jgi:hypothetical protein
VTNKKYDPPERLLTEYWYGAVNADVGNCPEVVSSETTNPGLPPSTENETDPEFVCEQSPETKKLFIVI